jgi:hypothetical protein
METEKELTKNKLLIILVCVCLIFAIAGYIIGYKHVGMMCNTSCAAMFKEQCLLAANVGIFAH